MLYQKSFKIFGVSAAALTVVRIIFKTLLMDVTNGFYSRESISGLIFNAAMLAAIALVGVTALLEKGELDATPFKAKRNVEASATAMGAVITIVSGIRFGQAQALTQSAEVINTVPKGTLMLVHGLGVVSGISMIVMAVFLLSGANKKGTAALLALAPALWHALWMTVRYMSFRFTTVASDQLFETLFMALASMFLLSHARCISGIGANRKRCVALGLTTALIGIVIGMGQLVAVSVLKSVSGPDQMQVVLMLALAAYALVFSLSVMHQKNEIK